MPDLLPDYCGNNRMRSTKLAFSLIRRGNSEAKLKRKTKALQVQKTENVYVH